MKSPPRLDAVLDRLRAYRKARKISFSALAGEADLSRAALLGMDRPAWSPSAATIRAVEALIPRSFEAGDRLPRARTGLVAVAGRMNSTRSAARQNGHGR